MTKDVRREEMSKSAALSGCTVRLLFVILPDIPLRQSPSYLRARPVSALDKDMYTWVTSAYK